MMNGNVVALSVWAIGALLGLVNVLIGFIVHLHLKADEEHRQRIDKEIDLIRQRVHDFGNRIAELITRARWAEEDRERKK